MFYVQEFLPAAVPCLVHHSCCFAGVGDEWHPSWKHRAIQSLEFLPVPINMWLSTSRNHQTCQYQTSDKPKQAQSKQTNKEVLPWKWLPVVPGYGCLGSGTTDINRKLGTARPHQLRLRVPPEMGWKCVSVCTTHHPNGATTTCLALCHSSFCAVSVGPSANMTQESSRGLWLRSFDDNGPASCSTSSLWSWALDWKFLAPGQKGSNFRLFYTDSILQEPLWMSVSLEKVIYSSDLGLKLKTYVPLVI